MSLKAITRKISPNINACELTHVQRSAIDVSKAQAQHEAYENLLQELGCTLLSLDEEAKLPDSVFVEDTAVILDKTAIITRPGAPSRRPETDSVAQALKRDLDLFSIEAPGTLDGGDVLLMNKTLYVGRTSRSNEAAISQLQQWLEPLGYRVLGIPVSGCLHLKTAVTCCASDTLLLNPNWIEPQYLTDWRIIEVDPQEPFGANVLSVNKTVICSSAYPRTNQRLQEAGLSLKPLDLSELAKAEGAVTCCSLVYDGP